MTYALFNSSILDTFRNMYLELVRKDKWSVFKLTYLILVRGSTRQEILTIWFKIHEDHLIDLTTKKIQHLHCNTKSYSIRVRTQSWWWDFFWSSFKVHTYKSFQIWMTNYKSLLFSIHWGRIFSMSHYLPIWFHICF